MPFDQSWLWEHMLFLIPMLLSLSVHEWAHAWSAWRLGDDTAARQGRLTLNPLVHIDILGTFLLPLLGVPFGWANPVPINPGRFRQSVNIRWGVMLTAAAGPLSNLLLAVLCIVMKVATMHFDADAATQGFQAFLDMMFSMNVALAIFNVLPVPPLDGSRIADALVPDALRPAWETFSHAGPVVLLLVLLLPSVYGFSLVGWATQAAHTVPAWVIALIS